jgi:UDP-N-acetylglucosamine transferase subunit ALG13
LILSDKNTFAQFHEWGTNSVVVQKGSSAVEGGLEDKFIKQGIHFTIYDYKPSLAEDMKKADLIICHAGAGTTMEALDLLKPVIVIPNRNLMDDHQLELASKLQEGNHAFLSGVLSFHKDAKEVEKSWFKPMPPRRTQEFVDYLSHCFFGAEIKNH